MNGAIPWGGVGHNMTTFTPDNSVSKHNVDKGQWYEIWDSLEGHQWHIYGRAAYISYPLLHYGFIPLFGDDAFIQLFGEEIQLVVRRSKSNVWIASFRPSSLQIFFGAYLQISVMILEH